MGAVPVVLLARGGEGCASLGMRRTSGRSAGGRKRPMVLATDKGHEVI